MFPNNTCLHYLNQRRNAFKDFQEIISITRNTEMASAPASRGFLKWAENPCVAVCKRHFMIHKCKVLCHVWEIVSSAELNPRYHSQVTSLSWAWAARYSWTKCSSWLLMYFSRLPIFSRVLLISLWSLSKNP